MATAKKRASKRTTVSAAAKRLKTYVSKRSFEKTPEPRGAETAKGHPSAPHFVVQKHAASHLHYDFRLEHDGVLWSWAVPKGPSVRPGERRLAARTEDHPLSYELFEGIIPKGQYGGGTVIVWDRGTWRMDSDAGKAMKNGNLTFELSGEKLRGRFHLVRTKTTRKKGEAWLLFKGRDAGARDVDIVEERPESVLSGRTVEQVEAAPAAEWQSNRATAIATRPKLAKKRQSRKASQKGKVSGRDHRDAYSLGGPRG